MRRAPIVLATTAAGLAGTLGFKTQQPASSSVAAVSSTDTGTASAASGSTGGSTTGSSTSASRRSSSTRTASSSAKTVTSSVISTIYGNVELRVTFKGGKVSSVENLQLPANDPHSVQINDYAGPQLQQSALSNADGTVDAVSGATYTTNGYQQALQSALDQAGISGTTSTSSSS